MNQHNNFFRRAVDAMIEGRTRQAERYIAQFQRDQHQYESKVNKR